MGHYNFRKDLSEAQQVETEAAEKIAAHFPRMTDMKPHDGPEYDLECLIDGQRKTFEVKNELMVTKTGNVAIEYTCRGKDSGIKVTTADFWVEKIRGGFFIIPTDELRKRIANGEHDDDKCGGDQGSRTCFYLVKEAKFISWCVKM